MPRTARIDIPGLLQHVMVRGIEKRDISTFPLQVEEDMDTYLKQIVAQLDLGLEDLGLKIVGATCKFTTGPSFVRFEAAEQEILEKEATA